VTKDALEREDVAAVAQIPDGEGVAEFMGVDVFDTDPLAEPTEHETGGVVGDGEETI